MQGSTYEDFINKVKAKFNKQKQDRKKENLRPISILFFIQPVKSLWNLKMSPMMNNFLERGTYILIQRK